MGIGVQADFTTTRNANIVTLAGLPARFDVFQRIPPPFCYIFQPCRADETIIAEGKDAEKRNRKPDGGSRCKNLQGGFNPCPVQ